MGGGDNRRGRRPVRKMPQSSKQKGTVLWTSTVAVEVMRLGSRKAEPTPDGG